MAEKSVAEKLQIKPKTQVWVSDTSRSGLLGPLPDGARIVDAIGGASVAVVFADDATSLRATLDPVRSDITKPAVVWIAYPKANRTDINRDKLWPILAEYGLRPNAQVAIDDVWSALRFRALKEGEAPFTGGATA